MVQLRRSSRSLQGGAKNSRGFTIIEVLVSAFILGVGLTAVAGLVGGILAGTASSEQMTQAATLATEKLEDLNRYPATDPNVAVTSGTSAGSLTSDSLQSVTANGVTEEVAYYDVVFFSPADGAIVQTTTSLNGNSTIYSTTTYTPNGTMSGPVQSASAPNALGSTVFKRRWQIDLNVPVTGVRTVTVLVSLENATTQKPIQFQLSMVRP